MTFTILPTAEPSGQLSRRTFLQGISAAIGAGAVGGSGLSLLGAPNAWAALGDPLPAGTPIMVVIEMNGGNDANNTLIPVNVPFVTGYYRTARPTLGVTTMTSTRPYTAPPAGNFLPPALELRDGWGLHGGLQWMANRWHMMKDVAIVRGVGETIKYEQSHFASMAFYAAAAFSGPNLATGWMGRYNDRNNPGQPLGAVSTFGSHDAFISEQSPSVSIGSLANFAFGVNNIPDASTWLARFAAMGNASSTALNKAGTASKAIAEAHAAMARAQGTTAFPAGGSGGSLAQQLSVVASLINAGIPCQTYLAGLGGFDNHGNQAGDHLGRLRQIDVGLAHFFSLLNQTSRARDVFVVLYSEFGRKVTQNGSRGTDHGQAHHMIVIGGGVKGGFYSAHPSLAPQNRVFDSMAPTVDFRSVYATLLNRLGGDTGLTEAVLGRNESNAVFEDLGLWSTGPDVPAAPADEPAAAAAEAPASEPSAEPSTTTTTAPQPTTTTTTAPPPSTTTTAPAPSTTTTAPMPSTTTTVAPEVTALT